MESSLPGTAIEAKCERAFVSTIPIHGTFKEEASLATTKLLETQDTKITRGHENLVKIQFLKFKLKYLWGRSSIETLLNLLKVRKITKKLEIIPFIHSTVQENSPQSKAAIFTKWAKTLSFPANQIGERLFTALSKNINPIRNILINLRILIIKSVPLIPKTIQEE